MIFIERFVPTQMPPNSDWYKNFALRIGPISRCSLYSWTCLTTGIVVCNFGSKSRWPSFIIWCSAGFIASRVISSLPLFPSFSFGWFSGEIFFALPRLSLARNSFFHLLYVTTRYAIMSFFSNRYLRNRKRALKEKQKKIFVMVDSILDFLTKQSQARFAEVSKN